MKKCIQISMHKKIIVIVSVILFIVFIVCAVRINKTYPNPSVEQYDKTQMVESDGFSISIKKARFASEEERDMFWKEEKELYGDCEGYFITFKVINTGNEEKHCNLGEWCLITDTYAQGVDLEHVYEVNEENVAGKLTLKPGESCTITVPFMIGKVNFTDEQWKHIRDQQFRVVLSLYPVKKEFVL